MLSLADKAFVYIASSVSQFCLLFENMALIFGRRSAKKAIKQQKNAVGENVSLTHEA